MSCGMSTALYTTAAGLVCSLLLKLQLFNFTHHLDYLSTDPGARMRPRRIYYNNTSFLDLLFNTLVGFVLLFIISFLLINPSLKKADIKTKAEFVITVTWSDNSHDDVDTWLQDPAR